MAVTKAYVDGKFLPCASLGKTFKWNKGILDVSIVTSGNVDLSPYATNVSVNKAFLTNVSLGLLSIKNVSQDASIAAIQTYLNSSIDIKSYVNSSTYYEQQLNTKIYLYPGTIIGLKNASGNNGAMFKKDSSVYLKINNMWIHWNCSSSNFK